MHSASGGLGAEATFEGDPLVSLGVWGSHRALDIMNIINITGAMRVTEALYITGGHGHHGGHRYHGAIDTIDTMGAIGSKEARDIMGIMDVMGGHGPHGRISALWRPPTSGAGEEGDVPGLRLGSHFGLRGWFPGGLSQPQPWGCRTSILIRSEASLLLPGLHPLLHPLLGKLREAVT